ncbi:MAG: glycoside hydrolase [Actinobacteria bacterium]|nr:glycoside hydrolase [Actinomycetota bacterium]
MGRRNALASVAVLCGLAGVVGAALLLTTGRTTTVSGNALLRGASRIDAINSPTIVHNPVDPDNVVVSYRIDRPNYSALIQHSRDGGKTWAPTDLPVPAGTPPCSATVDGRPCPFGPDIAFDADGKLYALYVNLEGNGNSPANLWLATSTDGGRTLGDVIRVAGELTFQARLAVAADKTVHATWLQGRDTGLLSLLGVNPVVAAHLTPGGRTFSTPVVVSDSQRERVGAASPVVDRRGNVSVIYQDYKGDRRDFENLEGPVFEDPFGLVVARSTDGGKSFSRGVEFEAGLIPTRRFLVYLPEFPSMAAGPEGDLYAVWSDGRNGDEDVFIKRSPDGGTTWSGGVRVNDNRMQDGTNQYLPKVAVSDDGRVDVLFLDRRRDSRNVLTDAFVASSDDAGRTFTNRLVSSESFDSGIGPSASLLHGTDFGTKLGLDSWGNRAVVAWTDTREGTEADESQDIAAARVTFAEEVPFLGRWPVILVLFVIGAAALAAALVGPPSPATPAPKEAAHT